VKELLVMIRTLLRYSQYRELYGLFWVRLAGRQDFGREILGEGIWVRDFG